ncbi:MAG TPA: hypothetical protein VGR06_13190 [Actinophytocola sp.]|nr:hypothetical protein [Actinophytocola sp.]
MSRAMSTVADTAGVEIEEEPAAPDVTNSDLVERLVAQARADGVQLAGEGGLLRQLTKRVLESALEGEITDHLGYANPIRTRVAGVLREGPAVPARQVARQPPHVLLGLPQRLHPGEIRPIRPISSNSFCPARSASTMAAAATS